ncbi:primary-amine oxidase [Streptosporangium becharense]|uniref:Amine oxidase n=1 Tax=Streptosporangium becharense TaxID=1816182 RepID=A0A7W9IJV8_9ACTN|nr:copper amine oxidase [Streptosporangium becharense]MBB2913960.1 primary-amine oxidase [Streptosporangium becharense]MBB5821379.1 primary-amine oxidase [Streptosporangium becharense]
MSPHRTPLTSLAPAVLCCAVLTGGLTPAVHAPAHAARASAVHAPAARIPAPAAGQAPARAAAQAPAAPCSAPYLIDKILPNGARWQLCWEMRTVEGLTLSKVVYTPRGGRPAAVLRSTALAQIHVPYDRGEPRYHDIGALGHAAIPLRAADCPLGERREQFVCVTTRARGHAYLKSDPELGNTSAQGSDLVVFAAFQVGWYTYLAEWAFSDDGAITPRVGATGSLAGFTTTPEHGWPIGVGNTDFEASHTHNVFWRLDFDVAGRADDVVEQYDFTGSGTAKRKIKRTVFTQEAKAVSGPMRWWRVVDRKVRNADRHRVSWEINNSDSAQYRGPADEAFTRADVYVTDYRSCERLASANPSPRCARSVDRYVNGERLTDPVLWVNVGFHHVARDEDADPMPTHWQGFRITPRDVTAKNPR